MEKLNEIIDFYEMTGDEPELLVMLLELRRHRLGKWQQRAEAAEARLAELAQQKPIGWLNDAYLGRGVIDGEVGQDDFGPGYIPIYSHPFNDSPAPAADLPNMSSVKGCLAFFASTIRSGESWSSTCQREYDAALYVLRKIEKTK